MESQIYEYKVQTTAYHIFLHIFTHQKPLPPW